MRKHDLVIPGGKEFIFTIFDDTDVSTLDNIKPVYEFLYHAGIFTTKSVWPLKCNQETSSYKGSHTLEDPSYADYIKLLNQQGFEIAFHGATMESSFREGVIASLYKFYEVLGFYPRIYACHAGNRENICWGEQRLTFNALRFLYRFLKHDGISFYSGHDPDSPYYWADICQKTFDYVRTFTFNEINLLNIGKFPYKIRNRPFFNNCFYTLSADNVEEFNRLLSVKNLEKLRREKGVAIVTTHFGKGFVKKGKLNKRTKEVLINLSKQNGHFVPVSTVLDYLKENHGEYRIGNFKLFCLELRWLVSSVFQKFNNLDYEKTELEYLSMK